MKPQYILIIATSLLSLLSFTVASVEIGQGGYALEFQVNGTYGWGTRIDLPMEVSYALSEEMSFECWFQVFAADTRVPGLYPINRPLVSRFSRSVANPPNRLNDFNLQINPEGFVVFFVGGSSNYGILGQSEIPVEDNRWYHAAFTLQYFNGVPQQANVYIDYFDTAGAQNSINFPNMPWAAGRVRQNLTDSPISLGYYKNDDVTQPDGQWFVGKMDEVRLWKGVRSSEDIRTIDAFLNRTLDETVPKEELSDIGLNWPGSLVASYNFNEGSGNLIHDLSNNHYDAYVDPFSSLSITWTYSDLQFYTYVYTVQLRRTVIPLIAYNTSEPVGAAPMQTFVVNYDASFTTGVLYTYSGPHGPKIGEIHYPELGIPVFSGDVVYAHGLVFVSNPLSTGDSTARFFYTAVDPNNQYQPISNTIEVRIVVDCCCNPGDVIDDCGMCNGNDIAKDRCGVCFGNGTCPLGCDWVWNSGMVYDDCGVCGGNNYTCMGCDWIPNSGLTYDDCGVCDGNNLTCVGCDWIPNSGAFYDDCGVCGGINLTCIGCDWVPNSGMEYDACGVCGGNNGTCIGCDGYGGGQYDICGKCRGDNSTCGGCDGLGGVYDACGVCSGDNSTCQCVEYHGYASSQMEYMMVQYSIDQIMWKIQQVMDTLLLTLEILEDYTGPGDLGVMVQYFNDYSERCLSEYGQYLDQFTFQLRQSVGLEYKINSFPSEFPYNPNAFPVIPDASNMHIINPNPDQ